MTHVSTRALKDHLSNYLHRAEDGERILVLRGNRPVAALVPLADLEIGDKDQDAQLAALEARGLVARPRTASTERFQSPRVSSRGKLASEMVLEDRR